MKYILCFTVLLTLLSIVHSNPISGRIMNGNITEPHQFPFICTFNIINLETNEPRFSCGASIINENWILTAAHCITEARLESVDEIGFHCGKHDLRIVEEGQQFVYAKEYILNPGWVNGTEWETHPEILSYDIALVSLVSPIIFNDNIQPVRLAPSGFLHKLQDAYIIGWGVYNLEPITPSPVLRYANVDLLTNEQCDVFLDGTGLVSDLMICVDPRDSVSVCSGDSGGPLVQRGDDGYLYQIGVTSWVATRCGTDRAASGYVGVRYFADWIDDVIADENVIDNL